MVFLNLDAFKPDECSGVLHETSTEKRRYLSQELIISYHNQS